MTLSSKSTLSWEDPGTWFADIGDYLKPWLQPDALKTMRNARHQEWSVDDLSWRKLLESQLLLSFDEVKAELAYLLRQIGVQTFHGCRVEDAGIYFRDGLRVHRRSTLEDELRDLVTQNQDLRWANSNLDKLIADVDNTIDEGRCFVVLDQRMLLEYAAHYLIYGSEWKCAVLGSHAHWALQEIGVPTLLEIELPMHLVSEYHHAALAEELLEEWARQSAAGPSNVRQIDFSFTVHQDIPPECLVGHSHPTELRDPLNQHRIYRSPRRSCAACDCTVSKAILAQILE